jgi:SEC-C motif-containing protein
MSFGAAGDTPARDAGPCPCGSGVPFAACCGPLLDGQPAPTPERLMRSRFTAFRVGDAAYLQRTWHPRTRPPAVELDAGVRWQRLEIVTAAQPGDAARPGDAPRPGDAAQPGDATQPVAAARPGEAARPGDPTQSGDEGFVEFRAHWSGGGRSGVLHERSRFARRGGHWLYVDGDVRTE